MSAEGVRVEESESIRDSLVSAMKELRARGESDGDAGAASSGLPDSTPAPDVAAQSAQHRSDDGRFAKREEADKAAVTPGAAPAIDDGSVPAVPAAPAIKAPDGWRAEMKAAFATLDPKVQAEITRRETELTRKITSVDEERTFGRKLKDVAAPYQAIMTAEGASIDKAFAQFLNTSFILRQGTPQQKAAALLNVARQFGVPLTQAFQQPQGSNVALHPAIETLEQRLNRIEQNAQARENQRQQLEEAELQDEIETFGTDPSHPHFEAVKAHMGALLSNGLAKSLKDAYDQACYAHPEIRSTLTAAQVASGQQKQIQKAAEAKKAAGSVVGGPGGASPQPHAAQGSGTLRDDIIAAMNQVRTGDRI